MPKRKLEEDESLAETLEDEGLAETLEDDWKEPAKSKIPGIKKNSLDSDEEDDGEEKHYDILAEDDIEGQEEGAVCQEGGVRITPFNMKEEMEEGHFDTEGNYHWKNEKEIRDNWLENIDWVKVKDSTGNEAADEQDEEGSDEFSPDSPFDSVAVYKKMLEMMQPGESVQKALRRLGGASSLSASERLKRKKAGLSIDDSGNKQLVTDLTELANKLLSRTGNMDIYQETYEYIQKQIDIQNNKEKNKAAASKQPELDMYADDFDEKLKEQFDKKEENTATEKSQNEDNTEKNDTEEYKKEEEVKWQFKWKKDSDEIHGPHTSEQMQSWVDDGYFKGEEWVRKVSGDNSSDFFSLKRVDFELYI